MKYLILLLLTTGCAMAPMTPQEQAAWRGVGNAASGFSQQVGQPQQQDGAKHCAVVHVGGGIYDMRCQ